MRFLFLCSCSACDVLTLMLLRSLLVLPHVQKVLLGVFLAVFVRAGGVYGCLKIIIIRNDVVAGGCGTKNIRTGTVPAPVTSSCVWLRDFIARRRGRRFPFPISASRVRHWRLQLYVKSMSAST